MFKYFTILLLLLFGKITYAQNLPNEYQNEFVWQVKQIDEFIERFNNDDDAFIKEHAKDKFLSVELNREMLIKSLLNIAGKNWNINEIKTFIKQVNDSQNPVRLNFYDPGWCAKVNCIVIWNKKAENVTLTLKVEKYANESSKWVITGVEAGFLKGQHQKDSVENCALTDLPAPVNSTTSLNPFSHATSFMNIKHVSQDKLNIANYFLKPTSPDTDELLTFVSEILHNRLEIKNAVSIKYFFYQVQGWLFEVQQYNRPGKNSGWLISKLTKLS